MKIVSALIFATLFLVSHTGFVQTASSGMDELKKELNKLIEPFDANVGVAVTHIETSDTLSINNAYQYPTQSVYKFTLALAVLNQVDQGNLTLGQEIHISKDDLHLNTWSPLAKEFPEGDIDMTLGTLLVFTVSHSDNNTCDILFNLLGGPIEVEKQMRAWNFTDIAIQTTEAEMHIDGEVTQKKNWCKPVEMNKILADFFNGKLLSKESTGALMRMMIVSANSEKRIKGKLPQSIVTAHKTGSGIKVVNDVGIVTLEDGTHLVISVFVCNSQEKFEDTEKLISKIAWAAFRHYSK